MKRKEKIRPRCEASTRIRGRAPVQCGNTVNPRSRFKAAQEVAKKAGIHLCTTHVCSLYHGFIYVPIALGGGSRQGFYLAAKGVLPQATPGHPFYSGGAS